MKVAVGKVVGGNVQVAPGAFADGTLVTVIADESTRSFTATPEEEHELLASIAEAESGHVITAEELAERLRRFA
jgi:hypothetical protein